MKKTLSRKTNNYKKNRPEQVLRSIKHNGCCMDKRNNIRVYKHLYM